MRSKFAAKPRQIQSSVDLPNQMVFGNRVAEMKLVEQLTLVTLQTAHHGSTSSRFTSIQRNHASRPSSTDFCNKIGQKLNLTACALAAYGKFYVRAEHNRSDGPDTSAVRCRAVYC